MRRKLRRIDENRGNDAVAMGRDFADQRQMSGMQGAHCRHQADAEAISLPSGDLRAHIGNGAVNG